MKNAGAVSVFALMLFAAVACGSSAPAAETQAPASGAGQTQASSAGPTDGPTAHGSSDPRPSDAPGATSTPVQPSTAPATSSTLALEIVQSQSWTDRQGNARANVLFRNPYEFPVQVTSSGARLVDASDKTIKSGSLYFLDGISGGSGYLLPGETIGANACFTCEEALLTEDWASVQFTAFIKDATDERAYSTEVAAKGIEVEWDGDSPIFWLSGKAENTGSSPIDRISVRVIVFDKDGNLIGAAEASGWDVPAGDSVDLTGGYGLGQNPDGPFDTEITALGVNYD